MKTAGRWLLSILILGGCGCSAVVSTAPVGAIPHNIDAESAEWEGVWTHADGALEVAVQDASNGVLRLAWIEHEGTNYSVSTASAWLREINDALFISLEGETQSNQTQYLFARMRKQERLAIIWAPEASQFRSLVEDEKLRGKVDGDTVILAPLTTNEYPLLTGEPALPLFNWTEPLIFTKTK